MHALTALHVLNGSYQFSELIEIGEISYNFYHLPKIKKGLSSLCELLGGGRSG